MTSATNDAPRSVVGGAGGLNGSASASNRFDAAFGEEIAGSSAAAAANGLAPGFVSMFSFPGTVTNLAGLADISISSVTLRWTAPGIDGSQGTLAGGSSYYIRVASYTVPDTFALFDAADIAFSTAGTAPGALAAAGATGLLPNTTYWARLWTKDPAGGLSYATSLTSFVTLAMPVALQSEPFVMVDFASAAAQWVAHPSLLQDVSSMSAGGYVLEASSTNFGAMSPGGAVYSSTTWNVLLSTLTIAVVPAPANLCETHYFRAASLNWGGLPNYTALASTRAVDDYGVAVAVQSLDVGGVDVNTEIVIPQSLRLSNVGCPVTYHIKVTTVTPGSPWGVSTASGTDAFTVQAIFNSGPPALTDFDDIDKLTDVSAAATPTTFAGDQTGAAVPVAEDRLLWFKLGMPRSVSTIDPQDVRVTVYASPP